MIYIGNAYSMQMVREFPALIHAELCGPEDIPMDAVSIIGHTDTAAVVSSMLGWTVPANRVSVTLGPGDVLYIAQLTGGRLPAGATVLPEGFTIQFIRVTIE